MHQKLANQEVIFSAVLATLALLSISLLANRHTNENLQRSISRLETSDGSTKRFLKQHFDRTVLKPLIRNEAELLLYWATNATSTLPVIKDDIEHGLQRGLEVKFLFIEPNSEAARMLAFRNRHQTEDEVNSVLQANFLRLKSVVSNTSSGKLEIRTVDYLPPYNIVSVNPNLPTGHTFVKLLPFRIPHDERPYLALTPASDKEWFDFFVQQFYSVWNEANPVDLESVN